MEATKRIPYGVANFEEVIEENMYYVDKTMYLPLLEQQPKSVFFIRPRRFGKSLFLHMLQCYYDIATKDKFDRIFLTGVSPVTLDDLTSGFNIGWHISTNPLFNRMLGFSREEVQEMFSYKKNSE